PPAPGREAARRRASRLERALDPGGQLRGAHLADHAVADQQAPAVDEVRLGKPRHPVLRPDLAGAVVDVRIRDAVLADEALRVAGEVLSVDADDDDAPPAVALPGSLQTGRLRLARRAPRGPEVEDDHLPAQRRELELA